MDPSFQIFAAVAGGVGLGQLLLFWVTRRSRQTDLRDERALSLEASFIIERRELLASLRAQLTDEQARAAKLETGKADLMHQFLALHKVAHEVVAKYDALRALNPDANLPTIHLELPFAGPAASVPTAAPPP